MPPGWPAMPKKSAGPRRAIWPLSCVRPTCMTSAFMPPKKKYNSTAPRYQEKEGPAVARAIMEKLNARPELIDRICDIIGHHHHPRAEETVEFKAVYDGDRIANLEEKQKNRAIAQKKAGPGDR